MSYKLKYRPGKAFLADLAHSKTKTFTLAPTMVVSRVSTKYELISDELIFHITPSENIFHVCFYCTKEK